MLVHESIARDVQGTCNGRAVVGRPPGRLRFARNALDRFFQIRVVLEILQSSPPYLLPDFAMFLQSAFSVISDSGVIRLCCNGLRTRARSSASVGESRMIVRSHSSR